MKITGIEKCILGMIIILIVGLVFSVYQTSKAVSDAGGIKNVIIDTGKAIKSIAKEIDN